MPILSHIFKKRDKGGKARAEAEKRKDKIQKEKVVKPELDAKNKATKKVKKAVKKSSGTTVKAEQAYLAHNIVVRPHISEKSVSKTHDGKYVFEVHKGTSKQQVAQAIETMYGVKIEKINKISVSAKKKKYRGSVGSRTRYNKVVITLKKGQGIEVLPQ